MEEKTVTIDIGRYEELLDIETRAHVVRDVILKDRHIKLTDLLYFLGFKGDANQIEEEEKEKLRKFMEKENHNE